MMVLEPLPTVPASTHLSTSTFESAISLAVASGLDPEE